MPMLEVIEIHTYYGNIHALKESLCSLKRGRLLP